jgi:cbb3-type cytochrome oxidase subunit 3
MKNFLYTVLLYYLSFISFSIFGQPPYEEKLLFQLEENRSVDSSYIASLDDYTKYLVFHTDPKSEKWITELINESKKQRNWVYLIKAYEYKSKLLWYKANPEEQRELLNSLFTHPDISEDPELTAMVEMTLASALQVQMVDSLLLKEARQLLTHAYPTLIHKYPKEAFQALYLLIGSHEIAGNYTAALDSAQQLKKLALQTKDSSLIGASLYLLAGHSLRVDAYQDAVKFVTNAFTYVKEGKDDRTLLGLYHFLSEIANKEGERKSALKYAKTSLKYAKKIRNPRNLAGAYALVCYRLMRMDSIQQADSLSQFIPPILNENNLVQQAATYNILRAWILEKQQKNEEALNIYLTTLHLMDSTGVVFLQEQTLAYMTDLLRKENIPVDWSSEKILIHYKASEEKEKGILNKAHVNKAMMNIYAIEKNYKKAFELSEKQTEYQHELAELRAASNLEEELLRLDNEAKTRELTHQKEQFAKEQSIRELFATLFILMIAFVIVLVILLRKQRKSNIEIKQQKIQLKDSNDKIEKLVINLKDKNKLLEQQLVLRQQEIVNNTVLQSSQLQKIKNISSYTKDLIDKGTADIVDLKHLFIKQNQLKEYNEQFNLKQQIEGLYPSFFEKLKLKHPTLTKGDIMHCAYALINLSTKQITDLHFISSKTVESARYRAKQKMNVGKDVNLRDYLLEIQNSEGGSL